MRAQEAAALGPFAIASPGFWVALALRRRDGVDVAGPAAAGDGEAPVALVADRQVLGLVEHPRAGRRSGCLSLGRFGCHCSPLEL